MKGDDSDVLEDVLRAVSPRCGNAMWWGGDSDVCNYILGFWTQERMGPEVEDLSSIVAFWYRVQQDKEVHRCGPNVFKSCFPKR